MGTGRSFQRPSSRLRVLAFWAAIALCTLYLLHPGFGSDSSVFVGHHNTPPLGHPHAAKPRPRPVQFDFRRYHGGKAGAGNKERAEAVRQVMKRTFWKYRKAAWGMDEVRPVTGGNRTSRNGWAATLVDTLTTTLMMGLEEEFMLALNYSIHELDFSKAEDLVDPFETTIRYLGSLVSTVDLLDAGFTNFSRPVEKKDRDALLAQALFLADKLAPGFDTPTGMIWPRINFTSGVGCREEEKDRPYPHFEHATIGPARAGSNWLENMALSRLSGLKIYGENATKAWKPLVYTKWVEEWPGLIDGPWDIMTGTPFDHHRSWGAGHDSYYEYLIKAHIMIPSDPHSGKYRDRWLQAVKSTREHLIFQGRSVDGDTEAHHWLHQWRNGWLINEMGHLACFTGGNWMLGGAYLADSSIVSMGAELVKACRAVYAATETSIGPEYWQWIPADRDGAYAPQSEGQEQQLQELGWWITDARYMLRPETVESYFYAYRITGDKKYQDWAWEAFVAYVKATKAPFGYAEVRDVTMPPGEDNREDLAESFWGAETLKYLWLAFCDEDVANLDEWVFSTEAHPFRIQP